MPVGFDLDEVTITTADGEDSRRCSVWVADSTEERGRGLMDVTDLGDADGMLFVFDAEGVAPLLHVADADAAGHRLLRRRRHVRRQRGDGAVPRTVRATSASGTPRTSRSCWPWRCRPATLDDLGVGPGARLTPHA